MEERFFMLIVFCFEQIFNSNRLVTKIQLLNKHGTDYYISGCVQLRKTNYLTLKRLPLEIPDGL